jgi:hypothetical protein
MSEKKENEVDLSKIPIETLRKAYEKSEKEKFNYVYVPMGNTLLSLPKDKVKEYLMSRNALALLKKPEKVKTKSPAEELITNPETVVKEKTIPVKTETEKKIVEELPTLKLFRKRVRTPLDEVESIISRSSKRVRSPTFSSSIKERVKEVLEPLFSDSVSEEEFRKEVIKPKLALRRKTVYKPQYTYDYTDDYDYEPQLTQIAVEDFAPKESDEINYNPQVEQESYPVFTYATYGIPDTFIDQYAPEDVVRIKPVTEFSITAKPKPFIVSQSYLLLLNTLLNEVTKK